MTIEAKPQFVFGVGVPSKDKAQLIQRLSKLKSTLLAEDGGKCPEKPSTSRVFVISEQTEEELDRWLSTTKGATLWREA